MYLITGYKNCPQKFESTRDILSQVSFRSNVDVNDARSPFRWFPQAMFPKFSYVIEDHA